tara:strand:- start:49 stop:471 length:423 start_codon:yes stop_codon:yes gene_type:complete
MFSSNTTNEATIITESNLNIETVVLNLKLISKIKQNEKLIIDNKIIKVDVRILQNIRRWLTSDGRDESIDYVEFIISETIAYINNLPDDNNLVYSKSKLIEELSNTSNGLDNLKSTYKIDNIITSRIDILKEKINNMCNK